MSGNPDSSETSQDSPDPSTRERKPGGQLPPPAFPPGRRRVQLRRNLAKAAMDAGDMGGAFISPDEPIPERQGGLGGALISPDDPIPDRMAFPGHSVQDQRWMSGPARDADGVVTGIGSDEHLDPVEMSVAGDPHLSELLDAVRKLASALEHRGESGLRVAPGMTRFELQLRAYCVGYLAGRRAEDEEG
ncbi:MAG: hypothetical protein LJF06_09185 [Gemmatimonadetes bacterium]|nr:hypothetical protein [Gemmatimonadota bacterium]